MFNYVIPGEPYVAQPLEGSFPNVSGSPSVPLLLCYVYRRLLYINTGSGWSMLAQLSPNQVFQQLSQPLLSTVVTNLQTNPNSQLCLPFAKLLIQGF